jgi:type VI secretion system secreted protein VgrG
MDVNLVCEKAGDKLELVELSGQEQLGHPSSFEVVAECAEVVDPTDLLGKAAAVNSLGEISGRSMIGTVTRVTMIATSRDATARRYRLTIESDFARLELRRQTRIFQHLTAADIIAKVFKLAGLPPTAMKRELGSPGAPHEYVVQYAETDAAFVRRICEDEGLYFRFLPIDGKDTFVLHDTSTARKSKLKSPLLVTHGLGLIKEHLAAWSLRAVRRRRVGKVTLRDYDQAKPSLPLEGVATGGVDVEQGVEVYAGPGGFKTSSEGKTRAKQALEAFRAEGSTIAFRTNALELAPGDVFSLGAAADYSGIVPAQGEYFVISVRHAFGRGGEYEMDVLAIPLAVPYRLPVVTPPPHVHGIHTATVTGAPGHEIHPDDQGRIYVQFVWDREGKNDHTSSLPIRSAQQNTPGSLITPRVGWEVLTAFEDGDPDRPYVLGRVWNAKTPPPHSLPVNKTVTAVSTYSSPGGGTHNSMHIDAAAGREHFHINAAFGLNKTVANNMVTQTAQKEIHAVKGDHSVTIGGKHDISVNQGHFVLADSQTASVGATQSHYVKGGFSMKVGSETVIIGAALLEKVGNPVSGAKNLLASAAIAGIGEAGSVLGPVAAKLAPLASMGASAAWGAYQGGKAGAANAALGTVAGMIPGGGAILASVQDAGVKMPWEEKPKPPGDQLGGGGAGAAMTDGAGAKGPGPGHKNQNVKGAYLELIGSTYAVATPGAVNLQGTGTTGIVIAGSKNVGARKAGTNVLGASIETLGSFHIEAPKVERNAKGPLKTSISGALNATAGASMTISGKSSVTFKVGGALTASGTVVVFKCKDSMVAAGPSGVYVKASNITITGESDQSGDSTH